MKESISSFMESGFWLVILVGIVVAAGVPLFISALEGKLREKLMSYFDASFKCEESPSLAQIRLICESWGKRISSKIVVTDALQDYLLRVTKENESYPKDRIPKVLELIEAEKAESPYDRLPDDERRLLRSLSDSLTTDDHEASIFNLRELESVLSARHKAYKKAILINKFSVPIGVVSLVVTLVFGVMSMFGNGA